MRTNQLVLLSDDSSSDFTLDASTREVGRRGIAAAREALRLAAERLSVGYLIAGDTDQCDRWTRLVGVLSEPPAEAMADA